LVGRPSPVLSSCCDNCSHNNLCVQASEEMDMMLELVVALGAFVTGLVSGIALGVIITLLARR